MRLPRFVMRNALVIGHDRDSARNYIGKVLDIAETEGLDVGEMGPITVMHAADCPMINGGGYCGCDPHVERGTPDEVRAKRGVA